MAGPADPLQRILHLYHFTDVRNLPMIQELGGIWSTEMLRECEIEFFAGGNQWSLAQDVRFGMDKFVHLCWDTGHPMEWHIRQRDSSARLTYLKIDRSILYEDGVRFSPGVANAVGMTTYSIEEASDGEMIDYDAFYGDIGPLSQPEPQARRSKAEKSEVLVPDWVLMKFLTNFPNG